MKANVDLPSGGGCFWFSNLVFQFWFQPSVIIQLFFIENAKIIVEGIVRSVASSLAGSAAGEKVLMAFRKLGSLQVTKHSISINDSLKPEDFGSSLFSTGYE